MEGDNHEEYVLGFRDSGDHGLFLYNPRGDHFVVESIASPGVWEFVVESVLSR